MALNPRSGQSFGVLSYPSIGEDELRQLRAEQAEARRAREVAERENSWMAGVALAPALVALGLSAPAILGLVRVVPQGAPLAFVERELFAKVGALARRPLTTAEAGVLRKLARLRWEQANGRNARSLRGDAEVHHSSPLEWAHIFPRGNPNRLANLWALPKDTHQIATRAWAEFKNSLNGRTPTQAEIMAAKQHIDRLVEQYVIRSGVAR